MIFFAAASQAQDKIDRFSAVTTVRHSLGMGSISIATYSGHKFPDPVGLAICACALRQRAWIRRQLPLATGQWRRHEKFLCRFPRGRNRHWVRGPRFGTLPRSRSANWSRGAIRVLRPRIGQVQRESHTGICDSSRACKQARRMLITI